MSHARTQIRQALVALLIAAGTNAATNVFDTRVTPYAADVTDAISVATPSEQSSSELIGAPSPLLEREPVVRIELHVCRTDGTHAEALDTLALQVETAIAASPHFAGVIYSYPTGSDDQFDDSGDAVRGQSTLEFKTRYRTTQAAPHLII